MNKNQALHHKLTQQLQADNKEFLNYYVDMQ